MPNEVDKSLLDRLAALRGSSASPKSEPVSSISIDTIERKKTPTREEALAGRLKNLRNGGPGSSSSPVNTAPVPSSRDSSLVDRLKNLRNKGAVSTPDISSVSEKNTEKGSLSKHSDGAAVRTRGTQKASDEKTFSPKETTEKNEIPKSEVEDEKEEYSFQTDDNELEDLLSGIPEDETIGHNVPEPSDAEVQALLLELADSVPQDSEITQDKIKSHQEEEPKDQDEDDDSDGEAMTKEVDDVIARFRDELELEKNNPEEPSPEIRRNEAEDTDEEPPENNDEADETEGLNTSIAFPEAPTDGSTQDTSAPQNTTFDSLTSRLSALRSPPNPSAEDDPSLALPSVPSSAPDNVKRLTSKTNYTDADMEKWCIVCLEDATVRCVGCDDDHYCLRCWKEMHIGPRAGYDERSHVAVEFGKKSKKKVAIGA